MKLRQAAWVAFSLAVVPAVARGDDSDWAALRSTAGNDAVRVRTRIAALSLACQNADSSGAADLAALAGSWIDDIDQSGLPYDQLANDAVRFSEHSLLYALACGGSGECLDSQNDPATMLQMWTAMATRSWTPQAVKESAFQFIGASQAGASARQAAILSVLQLSGIGHSGKLPAAFIGGLDSSAASTLEDMVRASSDPQSFNFTAAAVLADWGDSGILSDLQSLQTSFHAAGARYGNAIDWYIFQIQQQDPPSNLLSDIASTNSISPRARLWAVRRAVAAGQSASDVRQAIIDYSAIAPLSGPDRLPLGLPALKALGLQLGVLSGDDFPTVAAGTLSDHSTLQPGDAWELHTPPVAWQPPWEPAYANFDTLFQWMDAQHWGHMSSADVLASIRAEMCTLSLSPPDQCAAASQP